MSEIIYEVTHKTKSKVCKVNFYGSPVLVDKSVKNLVIMLNQIKGVTIVAIWEKKHDVQNEPVILPYITLHCPIDTAAVLLEVVMRCRRLNMEILRDDDSSDTAWCTLYPGGMPGKFPSPSEIEAELSKELERSGLLTQKYKEEGLCGLVNEWEAYYWKSDFKKEHIYMNSKKFHLLKTFARNIWKERMELFKKEGWEDERIRGFPTMGGSEYKGGFYYENCSKFPAIDVWSIEWQAWRMKIFLHLHDYGKIQVKSLQDIENKPFMHDVIIKALLS